MAVFARLPLEIRNEIYQHMFDHVTKSVVSLGHSATLITSCSIATPFLLVSKRFSEELLGAASLHRQTVVDAGGMEDSLDSLIALWPRTATYPSAKLTVRLRSMSDSAYRTHWTCQ